PDAISAFADNDGNGTQGSGEPSDTAAKTWVLPVSTPCTVKISNGGWIKANNGDKSSFGGNAQAMTNGSVSGQEQYQDKGANENVHSINVMAVTCPSPTQASIFGTATINGSGTFNFRIDVRDGASTNQPDMYGIMVGSYRRAGRAWLRPVRCWSRWPATSSDSRHRFRRLRKPTRLSLPSSSTVLTGRSTSPGRRAGATLPAPITAAAASPSCSSRATS